MAIEQVTALTCFEVEYEQIEAQLQQAQLVINRYRREEDRMGNQYRELSELKAHIDEVWAEVHKQRFALFQLLNTHHDAAISAAAQKQFPELLRALNAFSCKPHGEWTKLAVSTPQVLETGYWLKLTLLMTLGAVFQYQIPWVQSHVSLIRTQFEQWQIKEERTGFLKLFVKWANCASDTGGDEDMADSPTEATAYSATEATAEAVSEDDDLRLAQQFVQQRMDRMSAAKPTAASHSQPFLEFTVQSKSVVLVEKIETGDSDKDESLVKKYIPLTEPMPLSTLKLGAELIQEVLNKEFPWMHPITAQMYRALLDSQRYQLGSALIKPILLVGGPGVGKTHYLQRLADLMAVPQLVLSVGGMSDNMTLKGSSRSWSNARPSVISDFINQNLCPNPVVILDEIEKGGQGRNNGNVYDTLLQLLEPQNAAKFYDECLLANIDLSRVTYLATANSTEGLPEPIKDRMTVFKVPEPTANDRFLVAQQQWWAYWTARQIPMSAAPAFDAKFVGKLLKKATSLRQVKHIMDVYLKNASAACPLMQVH